MKRNKNQHERHGGLPIDKSALRQQIHYILQLLPKIRETHKALIRHLPQVTSAEDISDGQVSLGFDVVSVKQMKTTRRSPPEESKIINLFLFLVTLPRTAKSQENFRFPSLCHIAIRVEAYRAKNSLTQYYNCQEFGQVWANCK
jgi:hypothetical protein